MKEEMSSTCAGFRLCSTHPSHTMRRVSVPDKGVGIGLLLPAKSAILDAEIHTGDPMPSSRTATELML